MGVNELPGGGVASESLREDNLRRLHARVIDDAALIQRLLERARRNQLALRHVQSDGAYSETVWIHKIGSEEIFLRGDRGITSGSGDSLAVFKLETDGRLYFFTVPILEILNDGIGRVALPVVLYEEERRDRARRLNPPGVASAIYLRFSNQQSARGELADESADGLSVLLEESIYTKPGMLLEISRLKMKAGGQGDLAEVRNHQALNDRPGWKRIGLSILPRPRGGNLIIDRWSDVRQELRNWSDLRGREKSKSQRSRIVTAAYESSAEERGIRIEPNVIEYRNAQGEIIKAILDVTGDPRGAPAVVIPPAWGKTKETVLPLAAIILSMFRSAGHPVVVLRFDGIRKRGESHNDKACVRPGYENVNYTFSQGARDILTTIDFLHSEPQFRPSTTILVTFSAASVEARRAIVLESRGLIGGWISIVGAPDLQSIIRAVSGGIDYLGGVERGLRFGLQGVQGLLLDIDRAGVDAIENRLGFLGDARQDMAKVNIPVTWICGRYDAWMDMERVRDILSIGNTKNRRIIEVPTGHELRSSREAKEIFQVVGAEVSRMALGERLATAGEGSRALLTRQRAERRRLKPPAVNVSDFWREYLVGRDTEFGVDLIASTEIYRKFMREQIAALELSNGDVIADLGAGVGVLAREIRRSSSSERGLRIVQVDLIREALARSGHEARRHEDPTGVELSSIVADLECADCATSIPLRHRAFDAVIASLLVNYVANAEPLLREMRELLRPGGRLVVSSLRQDADISMICVRGVAELRTGRGREVFGELEGRAEKSLGEFISNAARLVDLEEQGRFRFWNSSELSRILRKAGFSRISIVPGFGDPPQAYIATAERSRKSTDQ